MNEQQREQTDTLMSAQRKAQWVRPEFCSLEAGAAEFGDISSADAQPGFS